MLIAFAGVTLDNVETQPIDIATAPVPPEVVPTSFSPEISAEAKRYAYQNVAEPGRKIGEEAEEPNLQETRHYEPSAQEGAEKKQEGEVFSGDDKAGSMLGP